MLLLTGSELTKAEQAAEKDLSVLQMMENAGRALAGHLIQYHSDKTHLFLCGKGKNGGDGLAAAAFLHQKGVPTCCLAPLDGLCPEVKHFKAQYEAVGGTMLPLTPEELSKQLKKRPALLVDCLLGTGLTRPVSGNLADCITQVNQSGLPVVAADIASGLSVDSGAVLGVAVRAQETISFTAAKPGQVFYPGCEYTGRLFVYDVGIPAKGLLQAADDALVRMALPPREKESHKGHYGKAALFCGAVGYTGAAFLSAQATVRTGAGLVSVGVPAAIYPIVAGKLVEAMVYPLPDKDGYFDSSAMEAAAQKAKEADVVLCGCGIGRSEGAFALAKAVLKGAAGPVILDADGINAFASHIDLLQEEAKQKPVILTPHDGELSRLIGQTVPADYARRLALAKEIAADLGVILVMKGHKTITAAPDGRTVINTSGNPGMARGGSGDVLAGMIAGLATRKGSDPFTAAAAAVYLHGKAGDAACVRLGEVGMLPSDMLMLLPETMQACLQ
jgi:hydroxyethylthiazole kinase-like uncharacterized protein yjeF